MKHEWLLKRNCSMSPSQAGRAYGLLCVFVLAIAAGFALQGIWFVLPFALLEIGGLSVALLFYARHATDREHISLGDGCLLIERIEAGALHQVRLDPCWTKITVPTRRRTLIQLEARGVRVEVGAFVSEQARQTVAAELRRELRSASLLA
jgi:uncharacterized membrane protein